MTREEATAVVIANFVNGPPGARFPGEPAFPRIEAEIPDYDLAGLDALAQTLGVTRESAVAVAIRDFVYGSPDMSGEDT